MKHFIVHKPLRQTVTVGIQGAGAHSGATHLSLMLATYLSAVRSYRVAVVSLSPNNHLMQAEELRDSLGRKPYRKLFAMYGQADEGLIMELLQLPREEQFDVVLIDCGNANDLSGIGAGKTVFHYCNRRLIATNLSWWRFAECVDYLERSRDSHSVGKTDGAYGEILGYDMVPQVAGYLRREYGVRIREIPYEPDPFCLHESGLSFCEQLTADW